jgi:hypothetical protein
VTLRETEAIFAALDLYDWMPGEIRQRIYEGLDVPRLASVAGESFTHPRALTDAETEIAAIIWVFRLLQGRNLVRPTPRPLDVIDEAWAQETVH